MSDSSNWFAAEKVGAFAAVIAAMVAGFALYVAYEQLVSGNRAWLTPQEMAFEQPAKSGDPILLKGRLSVVLLKLENVGNEPARNVVHSIEVRTVTPQQYTDTEFMARSFGKNMGGANCSAVTPSERGVTVFPKTSHGVRIRIEPQDVNKIIDGTKFLVLSGCFAYIAMNEIRRTGFCRFFDPTDNGPPETWKPSICVGDYAD